MSENDRRKSEPVMIAWLREADFVGGDVEIEWDHHRADSPRHLASWASTDRGWLRVDSRPAAFYLDYAVEGQQHYRSPHAYCPPGRCGCRRSQPGDVLACVYRDGQPRRSRWCENVEDAVRWLEAAAVGGEVAIHRVEAEFARRWKLVYIGDLAAGVTVHLDDGRTAVTTVAQGDSRVEFPEVEGPTGPYRPYEYLVGDVVVRVAS